MHADEKAEKINYLAAMLTLQELESVNIQSVVKYIKENKNKKE